MYDRYWSSEAQRHSSLDRYFAVGTAILTSGTALALFSSYPNASKVIAFSASVVSIIHATIFNRTRVKQVSSLAAKWRELAIELKLLWSQVRSKSSDHFRLWKEYESLSRREKQIDDSAFKVNRSRMKLAQDQVFQARGLHYEHQRPQDAAATSTATTTAPATAATANSNP